MSSPHDVCDYQSVVKVLNIVERYSTAHSRLDANTTLVHDHGLSVVSIDGSEQHKLGFPLVAIGILCQLFESSAFPELTHNVERIVQVRSSTDVTSTIILSSQPSDDNICSRRITVGPRVRSRKPLPAFQVIGLLPEEFRKLLRIIS
jgi:hypothetical protein